MNGSNAVRYAVYNSKGLFPVFHLTAHVLRTDEDVPYSVHASCSDSGMTGHVALAISGRLRWAVAVDGSLYPLLNKSEPDSPHCVWLQGRSLVLWAPVGAPFLFLMANAFVPSPPVALRDLLPRDYTNVCTSDRSVAISYRGPNGAPECALLSLDFDPVAIFPAADMLLVSPSGNLVCAVLGHMVWLGNVV